MEMEKENRKWRSKKKQRATDLNILEAGSWSEANATVSDPSCVVKTCSSRGFEPVEQWGEFVFGIYPVAVFVFHSSV